IANRRGIFARLRVVGPDDDAPSSAPSSAPPCAPSSAPPSAPSSAPPSAPSSAPPPAPPSALEQAFRSDDPAERLRLCVQALGDGRTPATLVATASACMEVNDLEAARRDLEAAVSAAPDW